MQHQRLVSRASGLILTTLLFFATACTPVQPVPTATSTMPATATAPGVEPTPTLEPFNLTQDALDTLLSVEMVDDYPLYTMHYVGGYDIPPKLTALPSGLDFGCSLFTSMGGNGDKLYGRNFDWEYSPALLVYTDPPDGYASVGMVNLFFLRMDWKAAAVLDRIPVDARTSLLAAPNMTMDGMNEYGLVIGMALVTDGKIDDPAFDPSRPTVGPLTVLRQMLDHARNVDEAVKVFTQYNVDFSGAIPIHYLLADPSGKAALLEFHDQELIRLNNIYPWHLATNHLRCIATGDGGCWRYKVLTDRLVGRKGVLDPAAAMQLLSDVKVDGTQWSAVYNMDTGDVNLVMGTEYNTVYTFHIDLVKP